MLMLISYCLHLPTFVDGDIEDRNVPKIDLNLMNEMKKSEK